MNKPKTPKPDGWIAEYEGDATRCGEFNAGKYIPVCINKNDLDREYGNNPAWTIKPVYFSDTPPVGKVDVAKLISLVAEIANHLLNGEEGLSLYMLQNDLTNRLEAILPEQPGE